MCHLSVAAIVAALRGDVPNSQSYPKAHRRLTNQIAADRSRTVAASVRNCNVIGCRIVAMCAHGAESGLSATGPVADAPPRRPAPYTPALPHLYGRQSSLDVSSP